MLLLELMSWIETSGASEPLTRFEWMLISTNILLAGITVFYAIKTSNIAKKTGEQAEATNAMVQISREQMEYNQQPFMLVKHYCTKTGIGTKTELDIKFRFVNKGSLPIELIKSEFYCEEKFLENQVRPTTMQTGASGEFNYSYTVENSDTEFDFIIYYQNALTGKLYYNCKSMLWNNRKKVLLEVYNSTDTMELPEENKISEPWYVFE